jgi:hypothetical protein
LPAAASARFALRIAANNAMLAPTITRIAMVFARIDHPFATFSRT